MIQCVEIKFLILIQRITTSLLWGTSSFFVFSMNFTEVERVIVNLGILSQIKKNTKISVTDPEYPSLQDNIPGVTWLVRWFWGDDKEKTIIKVKQIVNKAEEFLKNPETSEEHRNQLLSQLSLVPEGLDNLEYTYSAKVKYAKQIHLIINQVNDILNREMGGIEQPTKQHQHNSPIKQPPIRRSMSRKHSTSPPFPKPSLPPIAKPVGDNINKPQVDIDLSSNTFGFPSRFSGSFQNEEFSLPPADLPFAMSDDESSIPIDDME